MVIWYPLIIQQASLSPPWFNLHPDESTGFHELGGFVVSSRMLKNAHLRRCTCLLVDRQVPRPCGPLGYCGTLKDLSPQDFVRPRGAGFREAQLARLWAVLSILQKLSFSAPCWESVGLPQTIALRKNTAAHNAPGSTILARSGIPIPPEMSFSPVFRQTPGPHRDQAVPTACFLK
jgi:hypothetical protein